MQAQGFEHVHRAQRVGLHRELRNLKADAHMALRREVVDLVWLDLAQDAVDRRDVEHVAVLVVQTASDVLQARLLMLGDRVASDQPVDLVAKREQVLRQVGAVLPGDAGNQRSLCHLRRVLPRIGNLTAFIPRHKPGQEASDAVGFDRARKASSYSRLTSTRRMPSPVRRTSSVGERKPRGASRRSLAQR